MIIITVELRFYLWSLCIKKRPKPTCRILILFIRTMHSTKLKCNLSDIESSSTNRFPLSRKISRRGHLQCKRNLICIKKLESIIFGGNRTKPRAMNALYNFCSEFIIHTFHNIVIYY